MIWHGIYKQLVQVFIENISNQLFFAIFVNAEKICSVWKSCLNIFQQLFFGFLPQLNTTIPGRKDCSIHIQIHNIGRVSQTYWFQYCFGKNFFIMGNQGKNNYTTLTVLFINSSSKNQDDPVTVSMCVCPYILIFLAQPVKEYIHIIRI